MTKKIVFIFLLVLGCAKKEDNTLVKDSSNEIPAFNNVDSNISGIEFSNDLTGNGDLNIIEYLYYYNGGGVALGDPTSIIITCTMKQIQYRITTVLRRVIVRCNYNIRNSFIHAFTYNHNRVYTRSEDKY